MGSNVVPESDPSSDDALTGRVAALTHGGLLRRNVIINLLAWVLPAGAALVCIPLLARGLGAERFGLLALAWSAVGIFSLFDFGIGRALTRLVAERLAGHRDAEVSSLVWSATWILLAATGLLAIVGVVLAPTIATRLLHVPAGMQEEAIGVVRLLSISIPPLAHGVVLRGVLEAAQRFGLANSLRVPLGLATYLGPLAAIPLGVDARIAIGVIVVARTLYWLAHFPMLSRVVPGLSKPARGSRVAIREIASIGGWITISNVISPIIVQADRFAIAAALPIAASGWYGAASEIAQRQYLFTAALTPVLFAALAAAMTNAPQRAIHLIDRSSRVVLLALLPSASILAAFAEPGLHWWLGSAYSPEAAHALRWIALGVYANALAQIAYAALQSGVDVRSPALLHMVELPLYAAALVFITPRWGVEGVALAWLGRMTLDGVALWAILYRQYPAARPLYAKIGKLAVPAFAFAILAAIWGAMRW